MVDPAHRCGARDANRMPPGLWQCAPPTAPWRYALGELLGGGRKSLRDETGHSPRLTDESRLVLHTLQTPDRQKTAGVKTRWNTSCLQAVRAPSSSRRKRASEAPTHNCRWRVMQPSLRFQAVTRGTAMAKRSGASTGSVTRRQPLLDRHTALARLDQGQPAQASRRALAPCTSTGSHPSANQPMY